MGSSPISSFCLPIRGGRRNPVRRLTERAAGRCIAGLWQVSPELWTDEAPPCPAGKEQERFANPYFSRGEYDGQRSF